MVRYQAGTILQDQTGQGHHFLVTGYENRTTERRGPNKRHTSYELVVLHDNGTMSSIRRMADVIEGWFTDGLLEIVPTHQAPRKLQVIVEEVHNQ